MHVSRLSHHARVITRVISPVFGLSAIEGVEIELEAEPGCADKAAQAVIDVIDVIDVTSWTQTILLHGVLDQVKVKQLRYRLLHTAAWIPCGQSKVRIRIDTSWPRVAELAAAFNRLVEIRQTLII